MNMSCILFLLVNMQIEVVRYPRNFGAWFPHSPMSGLAILLSQWKCDFQSAGKSLMKSAPNEGVGEGRIAGTTEKYQLSCQQWQEKGWKALAQGLWLSTAAQNARAEFGIRELRMQADPIKSQDWGFNKGHT